MGRGAVHAAPVGRRLCRPEGVTNEWVRSSLFTIPTYLRDANLRSSAQQPRAHSPECGKGCSPKFIPKIRRRSSPAPMSIPAAEVGRCYLGACGEPRKLSLWSLNADFGQRKRPRPTVTSTLSLCSGTDRRKERRDRHQAGPADGPADRPVRLPRGLGGLPRGAACDLRGAVAQDRQEGLGHRERHLRSGRRSRPLLRLDRRPGAQVRRGLLPATVHSAQSQEQVV